MITDFIAFDDNPSSSTYYKKSETFTKLEAELNGDKSLRDLVENLEARNLLNKYIGSDSAIGEVDHEFDKASRDAAKTAVAHRIAEEIQEQIKKDFARTPMLRTQRMRII